MNKLEADIRRNSDKAFADHVVTEKFRQGVYRSWRCQKPGSGIYAFDITTIPDRLILTGDLGNMIVCRHYDMLPWCRGSVDSTGYFAEKVAREMQQQEFSRDRLEEWLKERIKEINDREDDPDEEYEANLDVLQDMLDFNLDDHDIGWYYSELQQIWAGGDPPNWMEFKPQFFWQRDAIRWFVNHHDEKEILP